MHGQCIIVHNSAYSQCIGYCLEVWGMQQVYESRHVFQTCIYLSCLHVDACKHTGRSKVSCQWMISQSSSPCAASAPQIHMSMGCMLYVQIWKRYLLNLPISHAGSHCSDYSHSPEGHARQWRAMDRKSQTFPLCQSCKGQTRWCMHGGGGGYMLFPALDKLVLCSYSQEQLLFLLENDFFLTLKITEQTRFSPLYAEQSQVGFKPPQNMLYSLCTYHLGDPYYIHAYSKKMFHRLPDSTKNWLDIQLA